ncbi:HEAT repeat domain-containing protein [Lentzea sp. BCCO 10_0856]|uniref:HEAT repeat domain-containing protein n=1 Tax=Lentzea miocenica TaxID=3095431 RepID=A0ABU4T9E9_9PSEU|nr:HEAT repeat domain-containing protein [Lentzea sp. BCCO 10_0856]MDX8034805.1 HEAT repeat domain-containing protein [Lentzea sp. BCCO 10_0856]
MLTELFAEPILRPAEFLRAPGGRRLRKPLSGARIAVFERVNNVNLPSAYKLFLTHVGDGGIGPGYGLRELSIWRTVEVPESPVNVSLSEGECRALRVVDLGGTDSTALLLNGSHAGRLIDLNAGMSPQLRPEQDFLAWYLAWLTEAAGQLEFSAPRAEKELVSALLDTSSGEVRAQAVLELGAVLDIADVTVELIERTALHDPSSRVRYRAIELLGELEPLSTKVFLAALQDPKRSVSRRALVHLLRLAGDTAAWGEGLDLVRSVSDSVSVQLADELERLRTKGAIIPKEVR